MVSATIELSGPGGLKLFARVWEPMTKPSAVICLVHGLGEHSGRYEHVGHFFAGKGYATIALDLPGHGKTAGKRGHVNKYDDLLDCIPALLNRAAERYSGVPVILYGHSMGGNIVANYVLRRKPGIRAAVVTSALFRLAFAPPKGKVKLASIMKGIFPGWSEKNGLVTADLSRDKAVVEAYEKDPLVHNRISAGLFFGVYEAGEWAITHAGELTIPMLVMHGSEDRLTSAPGSKAFADNAGKMATWVEWPGFYHETHNEPEKEEVLGRIASWIGGHLK